MKLDFDITGAALATPDYRTLRALLDIRPITTAPVVVPARDPDCSFSRAGLSRVFGLAEQGKGLVNLSGSSFGEMGGLTVATEPGMGACGRNESVQGSYA